MAKKLCTAKALLEAALGGGASVLSSELFARAAELGVSAKTLRRAQREMGVEAVRQGDRWHWIWPSCPAPAQPEPATVSLLPAAISADEIRSVAPHLTDQDRLLVQLLITEYSVAMQATREIEETGLIEETERGRRRNLADTSRAAATRNVLQLLRELGMTPSTREAQPPSDPLVEFRQRMAETQQGPAN